MEYGIVQVFCTPFQALMNKHKYNQPPKQKNNTS